MGNIRRFLYPSNLDKKAFFGFLSVGFLVLSCWLLSQNPFMDKLFEQEPLGLGLFFILALGLGSSFALGILGWWINYVFAKWCDLPVENCFDLDLLGVAFECGGALLLLGLSLMIIPKGFEGRAFTAMCLLAAGHMTGGWSFREFLSPQRAATVS